MENKVVTLKINSDFGSAEADLKSLGIAVKNVDKEVTNLDATFEEIYGDLKPLTTQMGEMEDRLYQLSLTGNTATKEYKDLLQAVGRYKQVQQETDKVVDAASMTMGSKLSGSLGAAAGGFSLAQGSMSLFGAESSSVEESILKVQQAMAISQGFETIREGTKSVSALATTVKSYSIVQKLITAGQWLWNVAMSANPLGAIVIAITAVIAAGYGLIKFFGSVATTSKVAMQGIKENSKALEDSKRITEKHNQALKDSSDYNLAMAKASGKSADEIRKLSIVEANADVSLKALNRTIAQNTYYRDLNNLATLKAGGATEEAIKSQNELIKSSLENFANENKALSESVRSRKLLIQNNNVEIRQEETDHRTKLNDDAKAAKTKKEEDAKAEKEKAKEERAKAVISEAESFRNQLEEVEKVESEAKKANADKLLTAQQIAIQTENTAYEIKKANAIKFGEAITEIEKEHLGKIKLINDTARLEEDAKKVVELEKTIADKDITFENKLGAIDAEQALYQKQFDDKVITEEAFNEKTKVLTESRIKVTETEAQAKQKALVAISSGLKTAATLLGESTAAGKAAAIAATTIDTIQSGVSAFKGMVSAVPGPVGIALGAVAAAGAVASGYASVKKIMAVKAPGGGGGGGAPSMSAPSVPSFNVVGVGGANQLAQTISTQKQEPLKAYVTAGDVTTGQSLNRNIINNASMG
jgi:hypothetical protein